MDPSLRAPHHVHRQMKRVPEGLKYRVPPRPVRASSSPQQRELVRRRIPKVPPALLDQEPQRVLASLEDSMKWVREDWRIPSAQRVREDLLAPMLKRALASPPSPWKPRAREDHLAPMLKRALANHSGPWKPRALASPPSPWKPRALANHSGPWKPRAPVNHLDPFSPRAPVSQGYSASPRALVSQGFSLL